MTTARHLKPLYSIFIDRVENRKLRTRSVVDFPFCSNWEPEHGGSAKRSLLSTGFVNKQLNIVMIFCFHLLHFILHMIINFSFRESFITHYIFLYEHVGIYLRITLESYCFRFSNVAFLLRELLNLPQFETTGQVTVVYDVACQLEGHLKVCVNHDQSYLAGAVYNLLYLVSSRRTW